MGKKKNREMMFWTKEQYLKFAEVMMDKPLSFYAFEMLYWCGIREGELLALAPADFDFEKRTVTINKRAGFDYHSKNRKEQSCHHYAAVSGRGNSGLPQNALRNWSR